MVIFIMGIKRAFMPSFSLSTFLFTIALLLCIIAFVLFIISILIAFVFKRIRRY